MVRLCFNDGVCGAPLHQRRPRRCSGGWGNRQPLSSCPPPSHAPSLGTKPAPPHKPTAVPEALRSMPGTVGWTVRKLGAHLINAKLPARHDPLGHYGGWPRPPETPLPPPAAGLWASAEPPLGAPKGNITLFSRALPRFTLWSCQSREMTHSGPTLGKLPGWQMRNEPVTLGPDRPSDKARPRCGQTGAVG